MAEGQRHPELVRLERQGTLQGALDGFRLKTPCPHGAKHGPAIACIRHEHHRKLSRRLRRLMVRPFGMRSGQAPPYRVQVRRERLRPAQQAFGVLHHTRVESDVGEPHQGTDVIGIGLEDIAEDRPAH